MVAERYKYTSPHRLHFSIPAEAFLPEQTAAYVNSLGPGGAYLDDPISGGMVAPVFLPDGAVIKEFTVFYEDNASGSLLINLRRRPHGANNVSPLSSIDTAASPGDTSQTAALSYSVDNSAEAFSIKAFSSAWPGNSTLRIKSVILAYDLSEVP